MRDIESGGSAAASATTLRGTKAILVTSPSGTFTVDEEINQATTGAQVKLLNGIVQTIFYITFKQDLMMRVLIVMVT